MSPTHLVVGYGERYTGVPSTKWVGVLRRNGGMSETLHVVYWVKLPVVGTTFETRSHRVERIARKLGATVDWMVVEA